MNESSLKTLEPPGGDKASALTGCKRHISSGSFIHDGWTLSVTKCTQTTNKQKSVETCFNKNIQIKTWRKNRFDTVHTHTCPHSFPTLCLFLCKCCKTLTCVCFVCTCVFLWHNEGHIVLARWCHLKYNVSLQFFLTRLHLGCLLYCVKIYYHNNINDKEDNNGTTRHKIVQQ